MTESYGTADYVIFITLLSLDNSDLVNLLNQK
jgi:hypothetical protein